MIFPHLQKGKANAFAYKQQARKLQATLVRNYWRGWSVELLA